MSSNKIISKTRLTSGFASILAILSALLNGITGLLLVLMYSVIIAPDFISPKAWDIFLLAIIIVLFINYVVTGLLLYTPLQELLTYATKLSLSFLLALISIASILVVTAYGNYVELQPFGIMATALFILEIFVLYFISSVRSKKLMLILRHRQALEQLSNLTSSLTDQIKDKKIYQQLVKASSQAFTTWGLILRSELVERWDLAKVFNRSIILAILFFIASALVGKILAGNIYALVVGVLAFLSMITLASYDLIRSQRIRTKII